MFCGKQNIRISASLFSLHEILTVIFFASSGVGVAISESVKTNVMVSCVSGTSVKTMVSAYSPQYKSDKRNML